MISNPKTASVTDLRQNATNLLREVHETKEPVFIIQNSKKAAVLLDEDSYEDLLEAYMDKRDYEIAEAALRDKTENAYTLKQVEAMMTKKKKA